MEALHPPSSERLQGPITGALCQHQHADSLLSGVMDGLSARLAYLKCEQKKDPEGRKLERGVDEERLGQRGGPTGVSLSKRALAPRLDPSAQRNKPLWLTG